MADILALLSGGLIGFALGLVGGGGSILAVPLLVYAVGIDDPHLAIGTSAVAVAANALVNLAGRMRKGLVKWRCAAVFALAGVVGALAGAQLGKLTDGDLLLALFAGLMILIGILMLRRKGSLGDAEVRLGRENGPKLVGFGLATGLLSGFFGIGGGFLIVPGLMAATGMPIAFAMASSLVAVTAFGATTSTSYAAAGLVDWRVAALVILGGAIGGLGGSWLSHRLAERRGALNLVFALLVFVVAAYMLWKSVGALAAG